MIDIMPLFAFVILPVSIGIATVIITAIMVRKNR